MQNLKYYKQEGDNYIFTNLIFTRIIALIAFAGFTYAVWKMAANKMWVLVPLGCMVIGILNMVVQKFVIDTKARKIIARATIFNPTREYDLDKFITFEVHRVRYFGLITINASLLMYFEKNGKEKRVGVTNGLSGRTMQKILNETEDIMNIGQAQVEYGR